MQDYNHLAEFARGQIKSYGPQTTGMIVAVFHHTLGNALPGETTREKWDNARAEIGDSDLVLDGDTDTWTLPVAAA